MTTIEWVRHGGEERAYVTMPETPVSELELLHRLSDGRFAVISADSGFVIPLNNGNGGRAGALRGAAEELRRTAREFEMMAEDLARAAIAAAEGEQVSE